MIRVASHAGDSDAGRELPKPGLLGRFIRLGLGAGALLLLVGLHSGWRDDLWTGRLPFDLGFAVLVVLALTFTSYVFDIALGLQWDHSSWPGTPAGRGSRHARLRDAVVRASPRAPSRGRCLERCVSRRH